MDVIKYDIYYNKSSVDIEKYTEVILLRKTIKGYKYRKEFKTEGMSYYHILHKGEEYLGDFINKQIKVIMKKRNDNVWREGYVSLLDKSEALEILREDYYGIV